MKTRLLRVSSICAAPVLALGFSSAQAAFLHWQGGTGDLLDANWYNESTSTDDVAPATGDELNIGANGDVTFSGTFNPFVFRVGHPFPPPPHPNLAGQGTYTQSGGSLTVNHHVALGVEHGGTVELTGDAAFSVLSPANGGAAIGALHVGFNTPDVSSLILRNNAAVTAGFLEIGVFAQSPAGVAAGQSIVEIHDNASITLNNRDRVIIGNRGNTVTGNQTQGVLTMSGGSLTLGGTGTGPNADLVVGWDGRGTVNMSAGVINIANDFVTALAPASGARPKSNAVINHSGGEINAERMRLSERGDTEYNMSGTALVNVRRRLILGQFEDAGIPGTATFNQSGGTVNVDTANLAGADVGLLIGAFGHGTYNLHGGVLNVPENMWMGEQGTSAGHLNITGGQANVGLDVGLSLRGTSQITQSGGEMNIGRSVLISNGALSMAATGTYEISGGELDVGLDFVVGFANGNGRFRVIGDGGQIDIGNNYFQDPNGELFVQLSALGGLSTINVGNEAHFLPGTTLEADLTPYAYSPGDSWDVLTAADIFDNGINFVAADPLGFGIDYRIVSGGNGEILQVYVIPEPASLGLLGMAGLMLLRRRAATA